MDLQIENIKQIMDGLDLGALLPGMGTMMGWITALARLFVMAGPLVMLGLGMHYLLAAPKEANHSAGYRFRWGMGSVEAWQFTQRLAGLVWCGLGLVLTVVMAVISSGFMNLDPMPMMKEALLCLFWEGLLIVLSCLAVNIVVFARYDLQGKRRLSWKALFRGQ